MPAAAIFSSCWVRLALSTPLPGHHQRVSFADLHHLRRHRRVQPGRDVGHHLTAARRTSGDHDVGRTDAGRSHHRSRPPRRRVRRQVCDVRMMDDGDALVTELADDRGPHSVVQWPNQHRLQRAVRTPPGQ